MILLDSIKTFNFYCTFCHKIALNEKAFRSHLNKFHPNNKNSESYPTIDKYVCYCIGRKIQSHLEKEKKFKKIIDLNENFLIDLTEDDKLDKIIVKDLIEKMMPNLTKRQKIIVKGLAKGELQKEVAKRLRKRKI